MILHLTVLLGYGIPIVGWIVPILIWKLLKNDYPNLDRHGCAAANWVVSSLIYLLACVILSTILIGVPLAIILSVLTVVFPVVAAIKAEKGVFWPYPMSLTFIYPESQAGTVQPRTPGSRDDDELVELYRTSGLPEAYALRDALVAAGLQAFVENELLQGAVGEVPLGWATAPLIKVPAHSLTAAQNVLKQFLAESVAASAAVDSARGSDGDHCLSCGGAMGEFDVCEVCGWSWSDKPAGSD